MMKKFDDKRIGTGTKEWAEKTENIARGCPNNCLYCYAAQNANRFKLRVREDWSREELTKRAAITSYPARGGVVMFPSAHDITPFNVDAYVRVAKLILEKGNQLLIVSKPHLECIEKVCNELDSFKSQILFRFTIGTMDRDIAAHWEPGAPSPSERIEALKHAFDCGYRTSVSAEPLLGGLDTAKALLDGIRQYVTDTVWIGKMNKIGARVNLSIPENALHASAIEKAQADDKIVALYHAFKDDPLVRWKDSINHVLDKQA